MDKILKLQTEIGVLSKTETNPFFKSKYMDINGLLAQLIPLLEKHELTVIQPLTNIDGKPALRTEVWSGGTLIVDNSMPLPDQQDPQKMGSAITYYRRYALQSLFLLQAQDDDANHASNKVSNDSATQAPKVHSPIITPFVSAKNALETCMDTESRTKALNTMLKSTKLTDIEKIQLQDIKDSLDQLDTMVK